MKGQGHDKTKCIKICDTQFCYKIMPCRQERGRKIFGDLMTVTLLPYLAMKHRLYGLIFNISETMFLSTQKGRFKNWDRAVEDFHIKSRSLYCRHLHITPHHVLMQNSLNTS